MLQDVNLTYVKGIPTFGGPAAATALVANGLTGATAPSRYVGATASGPPVSGTFAVGDFVIDQTASVWVCTSAGSPGTWVNSSRDVNELLIAPTGATGETCSRGVATATSAALTSGSVYVRAIGLRAGIPVNNITLFTAGGTVLTQADLTHGWYALLDSSLHVLAVSTDQTNVAFHTVINTPYSLAVKAAAGATYITTYSGTYYIAESVSVSAASMPQLAVSGGPGTGVGSAAPVLNGTAGSQAAPPAVGAQLASGTVTFANTNVFYAYTS